MDKIGEKSEFSHGIRSCMQILNLANYQEQINFSPF